MTFDDFSALSKARRSIRYFDEKPVTREEVLSLLDVAHLSPSVGNAQPWKFHVVHNAALLAKLMETSCYGNFITGASTFIVVTCNKAAAPVTQEILWNPKELEYSCMAAMTHILLGATAMQLGSCWVSLHHGPAHELLGLPQEEIVVGGVMLGHYKRGEETASDHYERLPLQDLIHFHD